MLAYLLAVLLLSILDGHTEAVGLCNGQVCVLTPCCEKGTNGAGGCVPSGSVCYEGLLCVKADGFCPKGAKGPGGCLAPQGQVCDGGMICPTGELGCKKGFLGEGGCMANGTHCLFGKIS